MNKDQGPLLSSSSLSDLSPFPKPSCPFHEAALGSPLMAGDLSHDTAVVLRVPETSVRATVWGQHTRWEEATAQGSS